MVVSRPMLGICHMQICGEADCTDEELLTYANKHNPSGTTHGWAKVIREGESAPVDCSNEPERKHFILEC